MRKGLVSLLLLAAILLTIASSDGVRASSTGKIVTQPRSLSEGRRSDSGRKESATLFSPARAKQDEVSSRATTGQVQILGEDDAALLAEMSELQMLAEGTPLQLDSRQWTALAAVALETQAIRLRYEAQIARRVESGPGRRRVEIPMYAAVGDALRERFYGQLRATLGGEGAADRVLEQLGSRIEGHFAGFGVAVQTLDITGDLHGARPNCEVTQTIEYWNSVDGSEQLTTRRETHFPAWEDPSGDRWGALLAVVEA